MKLIRRNWFLILFGLVFLIANGQTLKMYFWRDDWALLFKLLHPHGKVGGFGPGILGAKPYKYLATFYMPFFPIFKFNPQGYFVVGLINYLLAIFALYLFLKELVDKKAARLGSLVMAAGFIASDGLFRIVNSWQNYLGMFFASITLYFFLKYLKKRKVKNYIYAVFLFIISIEFFYVRSHSLIFPIVILDYLFNFFPVRLKLGEIKNFILRQLPFILIFYRWYLYNTPSDTSGASFIINKVLIGKNIKLLAPFMSNVGRVLFPDAVYHKLSTLFSADIEISFVILLLISFAAYLLKKSNKLKPRSLFTFYLAQIASYFYIEQVALSDFYWFRIPEVVEAAHLGLQITLFCIFLAFSISQKYKKTSIAILFGLFMVWSQVFGYYARYPETTYTSTHRYLAYALIGSSILFSGILHYYQKKSKLIFAVILLSTIGLNTLYSYKHQKEFVSKISKPSKKFYQTLTREIKALEPGSIVYFDVQDNPKIAREFSESFSVGSMPEQTAIAVWYNIDRHKISRIINLEEFLFELSGDPEKINKTHSFYYGENGLINTTQILRPALLERVKEPTPATPLNIEFILEKKLNSKNLKFPIEYPDPAKRAKYNKNFAIYYKELEDYYKKVSVETESEWRSQENYKLIDRNTSTSWRGHRIYWHNHTKESITLDLGKIKEINTLIWINTTNTLTPIEYTIEASVDNNNWMEVKKVTNGKEKRPGELTIERFPTVRAKYLKLRISKTLSNDSPAINEIEVVNVPVNLDIAKAKHFLANPFSLVSSEKELSEILNHLGKYLKVDVLIQTNKGTKIIRVPLEEINTSTVYNLNFVYGGTEINKIEASMPGDIITFSIKNIKTKNLILEELIQNNLIKRFSTN